ncbi:MAG: nucleotide sugar dehydrogenase [Rhodospirillales bacterium]|nr:nucleotide sugar dehydrogenase [Rhodospirillales bacterium]
MAAGEVDRLVARFTERDALIGVIGLGYIGLPLSLAAINGGFRVLGFDINAQRVADINGGESPLKHIGDDRILGVRRGGRLEATADFGRLAEPDVIVVCVPTPLGPHREPDLSFVESSARAIATALRRDQLIILESTTYPGTTREVVKPILEAGGLTSGVDFFLAYSPEREDPGNLDFETSRIPKVVSGDGAAALRLAQAFYDQFVVRTIPVSSPDTAEAVKLTENIFRAVNVALVNELKVVFSAMGIDVFEVIDAARTKPFGFMPFYPGPGLGGHCIPIDPFYLTWKARELDIATRFIELAGEVNTGMPAYVVGRLREELDSRFGKGLTGSRILIVGLAYKKNVDDMRESPALTIIEQLERRGAEVDYHDPYFPDIRPSRRHPDLSGRPSVPLEGAVLARYDAAVIVTDHDCIDYALLLEYLDLIVDTRNVIDRLQLSGRAEKVAKA